MGACKKDDPVDPSAKDEIYSGGKNFTTFDFSENAFGVQGKNLSSEEQNLFVVGNSLFRRNWVTAPSSVQSLDGLGPIFNAISCGSCHFKDGRAAPPTFPDEPLNGLLFRLSIPGTSPFGGPLPEPVYGGQLQDKAILGVAREAQVRVSYTEIPGQYPDGTTYSLRKPNYEFEDLAYGDFHTELMFSPRIAPQIPGLGLLENVPESVLLEYADEQDQDGDGISGRANYVWDTEKQQVVMGRFGWKANKSSLKEQTAGAFNGDMGIVSNLFSDDDFTSTQEQQYGEIPNGGSPELSDEQLKRVTLYLQTLSVPARRNYEDPQIQEGEKLFAELNCGSCHRPNLETGTEHSVAPLNAQLIRPYSDLLLHDMGEGLADHRPDYLASGREWRTPPLWGIGMIQTVNDHNYLLHDGRARNLEEAILWHAGEADVSKEAFMNLTKAERDALIAFLESL
ncbi:MAG: thiol oxidoreductase [Saprospiraceae bacterium]|nr:MAG: thiol oxidoreductase [Saprospiraceae bacterium]